MKVLLLNPYDRNAVPVSLWPHLGLVLIASVLKTRGHEVVVVDYAYLPDAPPLSEWIAAQKPDLFGITLYTSHMKFARQAVNEIRGASKAPIAVGGPHATLYADELAAEGFADAIFRGECDHKFSETIAQITPASKSLIFVADPPDLSTIPPPDFGLGYGSFKMTYYPIQLSRGCPYDCSFCSVKLISTRSVRYRALPSCLDEIERAAKRFKKLRSIRIVDDCPTGNLARFKTFLQGYRKIGVGLPLHIDNLRADRIDDEMLDSIKRIGVDHLCIGVESGNERVFDMINKGEKMEDIIRASRMIKRHGIRLYTCFIVGLPGSTSETEMDSIRLARSLKPNWIYWNLYQPHKGTRARDWFEANGRLYEEEDRTSLTGPVLGPLDPPCDSPEFPADERKRMHLTASLMTGAYWLNPRYFLSYLSLVRKNRLWRAAFSGLSAAVRINAEMLCHKAGPYIRSRLPGAGTKRRCA
jgi:radical SAM superfamily enzyme YgiQ (UPF0313 family)